MLQRKGQIAKAAKLEELSGFKDLERSLGVKNKGLGPQAGAMSHSKDTHMRFLKGVVCGEGSQEDSLYIYDFISFSSQLPHFKLCVFDRTPAFSTGELLDKLYNEPDTVLSSFKVLTHLILLMTL